MSKLTLAGLALPLFLLFASPQASGPKAFGGTRKVVQSPAHGGTLQKMIVENGSVTMDLDLNRLNGIGSAVQTTARLQFAVAANSFFSILVFNDLLRGPDHGSMALIPQNSASDLPVSLSASIRQLVVEKLPAGAAFDLAVRDGKTGFVFLNVEGGQYDYDANRPLAKHHWRTPAGIQRIREGSWPPVRRRRNRRPNLARRNHGTDRDQPSRRKR